MLNCKAPIAIVLLLTLCLTFIAPTAPAYAFSLNDLVSQNTNNSNTFSGNSLVNILLGLLLGNLLGNLQNTNSSTSIPTSTGTKSLPTNSTTSTTSLNGQAIVDTAKKYMGVPYVWGGETPDGFDCSGFTQYVMKQNGISLPRTAADQFATGITVEKTNLQTGDLVFFTTYKPGASHVGFYISNGQFIHASSVAGKVTISSLDEQYYTDHYIGARRYN